MMGVFSQLNEQVNRLVGGWVGGVTWWMYLRPLRVGGASWAQSLLTRVSTVTVKSPCMRTSGGCGGRVGGWRRRRRWLE